MFKIFVIGFHRTGTRSVNAALQQLGWNIIHYPCPSTGELFYDEFLAGPPWPILDTCDGLSDIVTVSHYRRVLNLYPDSKFILTIREPHSWLKSVKKHIRVLEYLRPTFSKERIEFDRLVWKSIYHHESPTDDQRLARFQEYNAEVMATFNSNLLVYNANNGWEPLCQFLKVEKPPFDFPRIIK